MLCIISLDRYVAIVLATKYQLLLTRKRGYAIVIFIWCIAAILSMPPLIGWSNYEYNPGTLHCSPVWTGQCAYVYFTFTIAVIIPTTLTVISYIVIFWKVRKHRKRVSMWKNAGKEILNSAADANESGYELSRLATVNKSPGITRKDSIIIERKTIANWAIQEINTNIQAPSQTSNSPLLSTPVASNNRSSSKELREEQVTVQEVTFPRQRKFNLESGDVFYDPKASTSPKPEAIFRAPMILGEYRNEELRASSSEMRGSSLEVSKGEQDKIAVITVGTIGCEGRLTDEKDGSTECGKRTGEEVVITNGEGHKKRAKKISIGRMLKMSRAQKSAARKLSDKDVNELLNLSEGNDFKSSTIQSSEETSKPGKNNSFTEKNKDAREIDHGQEAGKQKKGAEIKPAVAKNTRKERCLSLVSSIAGKSNMAESRKRFRRSTSKTKRTNRTLREFQVAKTGAILIAVFMVCYGPYTFVHLCNLPFHVPYAAQHFAMWCVFLNSMLTPIIYGIMNKETRTKIKMLMKKYCSCS